MTGEGTFYPEGLRKSPRGATHARVTLEKIPVNKKNVERERRGSTGKKRRLRPRVDSCALAWLQDVIVLLYLS